MTTTATGTAPTRAPGPAGAGRRCPGDRLSGLGSTYLAIRIMVEEMQPLTSAGLRFLTAGVLVATALRRTGAGIGWP